MIKYTNYNYEYLKKIYDCYNDVVGDFYKHITLDDFIKNFNKHVEFDPNGVFVAWDGENVVGFIASHVRKIEKELDEFPGYISTIVVNKKYQRNKIGTTLLKMAEEYLLSLGKKQVVFGYMSTLNWPWLIPNTNNHDHNGAPGVKINSDLYMLLFNNGYEVIDSQDAFHLDLKKFVTPKRVVDDLEKVKKENIVIELYDKNKHYGLEKFYQEINSEAFERVIRLNLNLDNPFPFAVISVDGKISGWTGAFYTESSGRAHFDGIVISPRVRGKGLGRALFAYLAEYSKTHGSEFMTFFTGRTNFARYIYLSLGFKIIQSFAIMAKEIK